MATVTAPNLSSLFALAPFKLTPNFWYVYTALVSDSLYSDHPAVITARNRSRLVSSMSPQEFCIPLNLTENAMEELFQLLERRKWAHKVSDGWYIGDIVEGVCVLFAKSKTLKAPKSRRTDKPSNAQVWLEQERKKLQERRRLAAVTKVPPDMRKVAMSAMKKNSDAKSPASRLLQVLKASHVKYLKAPYAMACNNTTGGASFPKECGMINAFLGYCDNSEETARKMIIWTMANWEKIKKDLEWLGVCNMTFFVTRHCFKRIRELYSQEFVKDFVSEISVGDRYNEHNAKAAPSEGFGDD